MIDRQKDRQIDRQLARQIDRQIDRQLASQIDRQIEGQDRIGQDSIGQDRIGQDGLGQDGWMDRQMDRQIDRYIHTFVHTLHTYTCKFSMNIQPSIRSVLSWQDFNRFHCKSVSGSSTPTGQSSIKVSSLSDFTITSTLWEHDRTETTLCRSQDVLRKPRCLSETKKLQFAKESPRQHSPFHFFKLSKFSNNSESWEPCGTSQN